MRTDAREHRIPAGRTEAEMKSSGCELAQEHDFLSGQHILIIERAA